LSGTAPENKTTRIITLQYVDLVEADLSCAKLRGADLVGADLSSAFLPEADLSQADLTGACLRGAYLVGAKLPEASLSGADLGVEWLRSDSGTPYLRWTNLSGADLCRASLRGANLARAWLQGADLRSANLEGALLVATHLENADLTECSIYGISAWDLHVNGKTIQSSLVITPEGEPVIQVDNLEVAQFIYLLLNNQKIRNFIDAVASKMVLILGRFTPDRKAILDAIRDELRKRDYLPVLFDFEKPASKTTLETVMTLANMARFVIADITDAKSVLQELQAIVPLHPSVPVQPLLLASQEEPGMWDFFRMSPWMLSAHRYLTQEKLLTELGAEVIAPAEGKVKELTGR
jgi:hypothetical protein